MIQVGSTSIPVAPYAKGEKFTAVELEYKDAEGIEFGSGAEDDDGEPPPPQDYLPLDTDEMNETIHPEFGDWKFDTIVRGGQIGQRSIPPTKPVNPFEDDEEDEGAKKKDPVKDRPCLNKDWETCPEGFSRSNRPPFHVYDVMRGGGGGGMFSIGPPPPPKCVGKIKMR